MWRPNINLADANACVNWGTYGKKFFELGNHLGNLMAVINDKQINASGNIGSEVIRSNDYYAFGGQMNGRGFTNPGAQAYRSGFNGKENDNEVEGPGNQQDYGMRIYDPRIGKFLSVDSLQKQYPELTPYQFASNEPVSNIDLDGLESQKAIDGTVHNGPVNIQLINQKLWAKANNQERMAMMKNSIVSSLSGFGALTTKAAVVRLDYALKAYNLKPVAEHGTYEQRVAASETRNSYVREARKITPEPYLSMSEELKNSDKLQVKPDARFWKTNSKVNLRMGIAGGLGVVATGYGLYSSYENIKGAENKGRAIVEEGASWGGALYGSSVGATWGASIGGPFAGYTGVAGGFIGGGVGGLLGRKAVNSLMSEHSSEIKSEFRLTLRSVQDNTAVNK